MTHRTDRTRDRDTEVPAPHPREQAETIPVMIPYRSTQQVADQLGITESVAHDAVRRRLIPPVVVVGHSRLWTDADVEALRTVIERRRCPRPRLSSTGRPDGGSGAQPTPDSDVAGAQS